MSDGEEQYDEEYEEEDPYDVIEDEEYAVLRSGQNMFSEIQYASDEYRIINKIIFKPQASVIPAGADIELGVTEGRIKGMYLSGTLYIYSKSKIRLHPDGTSLFGDLNQLESISGLEQVDTTGLVSTMYMFSCDSMLTEINLSGFDTSAVKDMSYMFDCCKSLKTIDISSFDTSGVGYMYGLFYGCTNVTELDLTNLDTTGLMLDDFEDEIAVDILNLNSYGNGSYNCRKITLGDKFTLTPKQAGLPEAYNGSGFTGNWTDGENIYTVAELPSGKGTYSWEGEAASSTLISGEAFAIALSEMAGGSDNIKKIIFTNSKLDSILAKTDLSLAGDGSIRGFYLVGTVYIYSGGTIIANKNCAKMFAGVMGTGFQNLTTIQGLSLLDTSQTTNMGCMFSNCTALTSIDTGSIDTSQVVEMWSMFSECASLTSLDLSSWDVYKPGSVRL